MFYTQDTDIKRNIGGNIIAVKYMAAMSLNFPLHTLEIKIFTLRQPNPGRLRLKMWIKHEAVLHFT